MEGGHCNEKFGKPTRAMTFGLLTSAVWCGVVWCGCVEGAVVAAVAMAVKTVLTV